MKQQYKLIHRGQVLPDTKQEVPAPTIVVCAGGFIIKKGRFLFGKRSKKKDWAPGLWDIVGGKSLKNEHPVFTLQRETMEEAGVQVLNASLLAVADVVSGDQADAIFRYHIYMITHFKGEAVNKTNEHTKLQWFSRQGLQELPLAIPEYLHLLDEWLAKNNQSSATGTLQQEITSLL